MKVTNKTAYATIGCDVQLTENDRLALGIELDKVTNWLETVDIPETSTELYKAINKIAAFVSKFAIRPSETNVFTDSPEDFKEAEDPCLLADKTKTTVEPASTDDVITVDIADSMDKLINLTKIIFHATDATLNNIKDLLNEARELYRVKAHSNISFKCTQKSKEEVVNDLTNAGYAVVQNTAESLQLENYMVSHK
jgi:hypothetical protein